MNNKENTSVLSLLFSSRKHSSLSWSFFMRLSTASGELNVGSTSLKAVSHSELSCWLTYRQDIEEHKA